MAKPPAPPAPPAVPEGALDSLRREALLANPLLCRQPLVFLTGRQFVKDHHNTATIFQTTEVNTGSYRGGGALKLLDVKSGKVTTLLDGGPDGLPRDPEASYDGKRIVFSLRKQRDGASHIFEIGADGTGLRQLTTCADANDIDPVYLPDGGIAFASTRDPKYCMCNRHIMANLFRMDGDGSNIEQIGNSTFGGEAGDKLLLCRDRELVFNAADTELWSKGMIHGVGAGPAELQPAKSWGSHASKLSACLRPAHHQVALSREEIERVETWIDLNAPYYPKYETGQPDGVAGRSPLTMAETRRLEQLSGVALEKSANHQHHRVWLSFDRPALSPILARVPEGGAKAEALAVIQAGGERLRTAPRGDTVDFAMSPADQGRHERAARLERRDAAFGKALRQGRKLRDTEIEDP